MADHLRLGELGERLRGGPTLLGGDAGQGVPRRMRYLAVAATRPRALEEGRLEDRADAVHDRTPAAAGLARSERSAAPKRAISSPVVTSVAQTRRAPATSARPGSSVASGTP